KQLPGGQAFVLLHGCVESVQEADEGFLRERARINVSRYRAADLQAGSTLTGCRGHAVDAIRSQTRQKSDISAFVPSETRMYLSNNGNGCGSVTPFSLKCSITSRAELPVSSITKFVCESMARALLAFA